jgi:hypothetical protein
MILLNILGVLFLVGAINWIQQVRDTCPCSKDWRRLTLLYYYYLAVILNLVAIIYKKYWLLTIMFLLTTAAAAVTLSYLVDMRKKKCKCMGPKEKYLYLLAIGQVVATGSIILYKAYHAYLEKKIKIN